jgi:hypothetical protein
MTPGWFKKLVFTLVTALALTVAPASGWAQSGGCDDDSGDDSGGFRKIVKNGEVIYEYTGVIRVCGKVPKPNVVAILLEKTIEYEWESLKKEFLPKIQNSVKKAPF